MPLVRDHEKAGRPKGRVAPDSGPCCLHSELKSMKLLMLVLGHFNMAASVTVFFIYTCELLPTVLRYGVWWAEGREGDGTVPRLSVCQKTIAVLNTVCMGWLT